jgi:acetyl-CoA carboxylase carboxyltransferase component
MGGARVHNQISGCGDFRVASDEDAIEIARDFLSYLPQNWRLKPLRTPPVDPSRDPAEISTIVPADDKASYDMRGVIDALVDADSFLEVKAEWATELLIGFARLEGEPIGVVANQPMSKGGVLFVDSADKAARFVWLCDAFNVPLVFLADVPGFMIGSAVEREGIIRHGAKMISAVSEATVPKICVVVRKAFGAGLYAMAGPGFEPDATLALPTAEIAVMGPEAAVNAVFYNQIQALPEAEREAFVEAKRREYAEDIDLLRLASENVVDAVIEPADLRRELVARLAAAAWKDRHFSDRRHGVPPV